MKKLICITILLLCLSVTPVLTVGAEKGYDFETKSPQHKLITDLEILPEDFSLASAVTKRDFTEALANITGNTDIASKYFTDYKLTDTINTAEAASVLIDITGYTPKLITGRGGTGETAYMHLANEIGLLDGVSSGANDPLDGEQLVAMLYHALHTEVLQQTGFGTNKQYAVVKDYTLLYQQYGIVSFYGLVTANDITSLTAESPAGIGNLEIDGKPYATSVANAYDYLGMHVRAYYNMDNEVIVSLSEYRNSMIFIDAENFEGSSTMTQIKYQNGNKQSKAALSKTVDVVWNDMLFKECKDADLFIDDGYYILLDNNNDNVYDVLFIYEYKSFLLQNLALKDNLIYDRDLNAYDIEKYMEYDRKVKNQNKLMDIGSLQQDMAISVYQSRSGEVTRIDVSEETVTGIIEQLNDNKLVINGVSYTCTKNIDNDGWLKAGVAAKVYINASGLVFHGETVGSGERYGYLDGFASSTFGMAKVKIFTDAGEFKEYDLANKVTYNNKRVSTQDITSVAPQLVRYRINNADEVVSLAEAAVPATSGIDENVFTLNFSSSSTKYIFRDIGSFAAKYRVDNQTKIFFIPVDTTDKDSFEMIESSSLQHNTNFNVKIYDMDEQNMAKAVVVTRAASAHISRTTNVMIVEWVNKVLNAKGEETYMLDGYRGGEKVSVRLKSADLQCQASPSRKYGRLTADQIPSGSMIHYTTNTNRDIDNWVLYSTPDDKNDTTCFEYISTGDPLSQTYFYCTEAIVTLGRARKVFPNCLVFNNHVKDETYGDFGNPGWDRFITVADGFTPVIVTPENKIYLGSIADITIGDTIAVHIIAGSLKTVVVYK